MSKQTDAAYQYIKLKILDGTYKPSQKLIESQLSEAIGVSRNTIKKALLKLEQENLVVVENNKGAIIKSFTLEEVINYLEIRAALEGLVAKNVAMIIGPSELKRLKKILDEMAVHLENNRFDEYSALNGNFHNIIYGLARNKQAVELINIIKTQLIRYHFRTILVPGRTQNSHKEHTKIYEALAAHDAQKAQESVENHIANVRQTIEQNYRYLL